MVEEEYRIKFPKIQVNFSSSDLFFLINHVKSREVSALYFKLHCYDKSNTEFYTYVSPRWIITKDYSKKIRTFSLSDDVYDKVLYTRIELIAVGNSSENPLYFTECMFGEDEGVYEYHTPHEVLKEYTIGFLNSCYVNLYDNDGNYLQIIRPNRENISNNVINHSTCTVLAPHLYEESDIDDPVNVFLEFINQTEQRIDVLR